MPSDSASTPSPALVALAAWLVPGSGYVLLGQRSRGITIGITIVLLFVMGLLIAGVRVIEVPGYDNSGQPIMTDNGVDQRWILYAAPFAEIRNKPWSVPQVMTGPLSFAAAAWSVYESRPDPADPSHSRAPQSHVRINEIGSLYLSVAGLLNLMAIIDSSYRAGHRS